MKVRPLPSDLRRVGIHAVAYSSRSNTLYVHEGDELDLLVAAAVPLLESAGLPLSRKTVRQLIRKHLRKYSRG